MNHRNSILEAHRAVRQLLGQVLVELGRALFTPLATLLADPPAPLFAQAPGTPPQRLPACP